MEPDLYLDMDFEPGDIQLISNHTVIHSRTDYEDFEEPEKKRHLLRLWLSLEHPEGFRAKWLKTAIDMATPRTLLGKSSEIKTQATGPRVAAKQATAPRASKKT